MTGMSLALMMLLDLTGLSSVPRVEHFGWLSGRWVEEKGANWTEENWGKPRGGVLLGSSLTGKGGKAGMFEFMRISTGDELGEILFWASPGGKAAVPFRMVERGKQEVVFENPSNDYPTRIRYRREGDVLKATISGPGGANAQSWTYRRR